MPNKITGPEYKLFKAKPSGTSAVTAWTNPFFGQFKFTFIRAVNVSGANADVSIYHDEAGGTHDNTTILEGPVTLAPGEAMWIQDEVAGYLKGETVGVKTSVADAVNFTGYGKIDDLEVVP